MGNSVTLHIKGMVVNKIFNKDSLILNFAKIKRKHYRFSSMYLIMAFPSNYVSFGRSKNSRRMIPRPAQQSGNGRKTWRWVLEACASSHLIMPNWKIGSLLVYLVGVRVDFLLLKKAFFSCYTCIAA